MPDYEDVLQCFFIGSEKEPEMNLLFTSDNFTVKCKGLFTGESRIVFFACQVPKEAQ